MLIVEWTTVTFRSASLLTNKYRGGVSSVKMRSTSPQWCLYTRIFSFGIRFSPTIKRKECQKKHKMIKKKGLSVRRRLLFCLSKIPETVCLRATALCAVQALAVYERFLLMSSALASSKDALSAQLWKWRGDKLVKSKQNNFASNLWNKCNKD